MRRVVVGGLLLLFGLFRFAFAGNPTNYDLTIDPSAKALLKSHSLTIYQPYGLVKPGDRIVSITVGRLPSPNIQCQIYAGAGESSTVLDSKGTLRGFQGEVRLGQGNPGSNAVAGALLMHVTPAPAPDEKSSFVQSMGGFFVSHPIIWIGLGAVLLLSVFVAIMRLNSTPSGQAPIYGKRAYEENVREVKEKLERIMESQELLVRKPPVLRTFRKQIDRFDQRLGKLEVTSVSTQQALSVLATSLVDLREFLDGLSSRHDATRQTVEDVHSQLSVQVEEARSSVHNLREDLKSSRSQLSESIQGLDGRLSAQGQAVESFSATLKEDLKAQAKESAQAAKDLATQVAGQAQAAERITAERFEKISGQFAKADQQVSDLRTGLAEHQKASAATMDQIEKKFASALDQLQGAMSSQSGKNAEQIEQIQANVGQVFGQLREVLAALEQSADAKFEELRNNFGAIAQQLQGLTPLPANVSELHGRVGNLKSDLGALGEKLSESSTEIGELQRTHVLSFAGMEEKMAEVKDSMSDLGKELENIHSQIEAHGSMLEASSNTMAEVSKQVDGVRNSAATKDQVAALDKVPTSIEGLKESISGFAKKLSEAGLSKEDAEKLLLAHEKLGGLAGEISTVLQKSLEQKLTTILAQSVATKKGKESEGSGISDRGAAALSEVAKQLLSEIDHQKNLEQTLTGVLAKIEALPAALQKIDQRLAEPTVIPTAEGPVIPVEQMLSMIAETKNAIEAVPARIESIEKGLAEAAGKWQATNDRINATLAQSDERWTKTNDRIEAGFAQANNQWSQASDKMEKSLAEASDNLSKTKARLESVADQVAEAASTPAPARAAESKVAKKEASLPTPAPVVEEFQVEAVAKAPELIVEVKEAAQQEIEHAAEEPAVAAKLDEEVVAAELEAEPEPKVVEIEQKAKGTKPAVKAAERREHSSHEGEDWTTSNGDLLGTWATGSTRRLTLVADAEAAKKALTPTETPGIEYQIGPMLYAQGRVIYSHGDSLKAFWPGGNERSILLSNTIADEPWRMLLTQQRLFCVEEKKVEIVDTNSWSRVAHFNGEFVDQTALTALWVGLRGGNNPVLEFRDLMGEAWGKPLDLHSSLSSSLPLLSDNTHVWLAAKSGAIYRAEPKACELFCEISGPKISLLHFLLTDVGPVAIVSEPPGVALKRIDSDGAVAETLVTDSKQTSGNVVAMGSRIYFFDPDRSELNVCNLDQMSIENVIELPNVPRVRKMAGIEADEDTLMIVGCDATGKLGSVFLLDPNSGRQVMLCSTNQPHVDAMFGAGHAIVATSSSYQNIIRVFKPFIAAEGEKAA